jgi:hypothetical protein
MSSRRPPAPPRASRPTHCCTRQRDTSTGPPPPSTPRSTPSRKLQCDHPVGPTSRWSCRVKQSPSNVIWSLLAERHSRWLLHAQPPEIAPSSQICRPRISPCRSPRAGSAAGWPTARRLFTPPPQRGIDHAAKPPECRTNELHRRHEHGPAGSDGANAILGPLRLPRHLVLPPRAQPYAKPPAVTATTPSRGLR